MKTQTPLLWPIPQEVTIRDDVLPLGQAVIAVPAGARDVDLAPARLLADMLADDFGLAVPVVQGELPVGKMPIRITIAGRRGAGRTPRRLPEQAEGYLLTARPDGATIVGRDSRGAQHGVATLLQLAERRGSHVVLRGAEIRDWPHKPVRMVHLYLPGAEHLAYARRYLRDFLVRYKFNGLFVELGGAVRLPNRPEIAQGWRRFVQELRAIGDTGPIYGEHCPLGPEGRFSASVHTHLADGLYLEPDDLTRLSDLARGYQLDFVPEMQSLSHAYYLALAYPDIAELPEADFPDTYCPCNPRSYEILFDVMSAYVALTKCRSVHIGHDEWRAAGLCPKCRQRDTGELFGEDVVKIASWLTERDLGVWMWGDHLVPDHNARGRSHKGRVWYDHPDTMKAAEIVARGAPDITILNWSWYLGAEKGDRVLADLGFKQIFGNFDGRRFSEWPARSAPEGVLGAEISSWCAWEDFELGMIHYPEALWSANLLWSKHWPAQEEADEAVARLLPRLRDRMRWNWEKPRLWSEAVLPSRKHCISIQQACNAPLKSERWDLTGVKTGRHEYDGVPYEIVDSGNAAVVVERPRQLVGQACLERSRKDLRVLPPSNAPNSVRQELAPAPQAAFPHQSAPIPIGGSYASLIFWQVATDKGGRPAHAGDGTNYPREAAELLGYYEIRYADGLVRSAEIRCGENVGAWDSGHELLYYAREVPAGVRPDGKPLVIWGLEWTNPRPAVTIESVVLKGARPLPETRAQGGSSDARPMLLGITAIEHPKWEDYRPGKEGKLPGYSP